jgi:alpha-amylase
MNKIFQTAEWAHSTNIYEVNIRQYTAEGNFNDFAKELPRLKEMGVQTIWFMPITPISQHNRKGQLGSYYACSDYQSINPEYGTLDDFKNVVKKAHQLGFKVIIDWVANHTGWDHVWTRSNPEFYTKDQQGNFRPPFPEWEDTIQLDYTNQGLRRAMIEAMKFWIKECDLDGFRCDMAHLVPLDFWEEARTELDVVKPLFWLAETEDVNYHEVFDASYTWEFLHAMEKYWKKETDIKGLDEILSKYDAVFPKEALRVFFTSNHDENSHSGSEYERLGDAAKPFAVLCATWNGVPLIYSGQEMPLINKRLHFFDRDPIPWTTEYALQDFYKTLLHLHLNNPALRAGDENVKTYRIKTSDDDHVFAYLRKNNEKEVLVMLNLSSKNDLRVEITDPLVTGVYINVFSGESGNLTLEKICMLQNWGYCVFEK